MASSSKFSMILLLYCSIFLQGIMCEIICDKLPIDVCAFSIDSSGKRCLLENFQNGDGQMEFQCGSSEVVVPMMAEHIESQYCIETCELNRKTVGISSDALFDTHFMSRLCSDDCFHSCPNIVDLYSNLAAAQLGVLLPQLCRSENFGVSGNFGSVHTVFGRQGQASVSAWDLDVASVPAFAPVPL